MGDATEVDVDAGDVDDGFDDQLQENATKKQPKADSQDEDDDSQADEEGLGGEGVKRRLAKITRKRHEAEARVNELQAEVEGLRRRTGDEGRALMQIAEKHGILPELIAPDQVKALQSMDAAEVRVAGLQEILDEMEDQGESERDLNGKSYSRASLRKMLRETQGELRDLSEGYGLVRKELAKRTAKLLKLGLAAEKSSKDKSANSQASVSAKVSSSARSSSDDGDEDEGAFRVRGKRDVSGLGESGTKVVKSSSDDLMSAIRQMSAARSV